jgi:hypothetical protein
MGSDGFTPSRGAPCQYFIECGLYECCEDESNCLRAIATRGGGMVDLKANQHGHGWLPTTHQNKSREHPQAAVTPRKQCTLRKRFYRTLQRGVVNRNATPRHQTKSHCGFATRSRKETGQQGESSYGKIQLLSDRSRQKRVSTKPVNLSESPI